MPERSHYDVLGITPEAKPETVRRAYLRQARRWHPDRPAGDPARMRAVNQAWEILGNPRSRAAYDRTLVRDPNSRSLPGRPRPDPSGHPRPASGSSGAGHSRAPRSPSGAGHSRAPRSPSGAGHPRAPRSPSEPPPGLEMVGIRRRWIGLAVAALVAVAIALILVASANTDDPDTIGSIAPSAPVSQARPEPGDCFLIGTVSLAPVPCDHPHDGKLVSWVPLGAPCPPETELHWVRAARQAVCYHPPAG